MNTPVNTPTSAATLDAPASAPGGDAVTVSVNGETRRLAGATTLDVLVTTLTTAPSGVAAAVNETVVPRGAWSGTVLGEGDRVEVLTAVQGG
ncbi:sulfur carrier protein ThiS [Streptomyces sp. NPDC046887]|uniref:sulfur carrier protein ThiS n=1 Tax=Streptomyces sp. NPDC046887 TaxID=3155472 RepID=UPI0033E460D0